jgi:hypothetical protein
VGGGGGDRERGEQGVKGKRKEKNSGPGDVCCQAKWNPLLSLSLSLRFQPLYKDSKRVDIILWRGLMHGRVEEGRERERARAKDWLQKERGSVLSRGFEEETTHALRYGFVAAHTP